MNRFISTQLEPAELEERFRMETLARDKIQTIGVFVLTLVIVTGFIALDLRFQPSGIALHISMASRCVTVIVLLSAIWMIHHLSSTRLFDRIVLVAMVVHIGHMLIVNALRPTDYVPVIVWDVVTVYGIYLIVPVPLRFQVLPALLLTAGGSVLWLIYRLSLADTYETVAVLAAYSFMNVYGILVSVQLNRSRRQQFVLRQLAEQAAVIEERQRLARDLHDSVTQSLYSLTLLAEGGRRLVRAGILENTEDYFADLWQIALQSLKEMRLLIYELRPSVLEEEGLVGALQQRLDAVEGRTGVEARLLVEEEGQLAAPVEEALYRIALEALNNTLKHAAATSVTVKVCINDERAELEIVDDGRGFDPQAITDQGGMGLVTMRERAEQLGGTLTLLSAPGEGTRVKGVFQHSGTRSPSTRRASW